MSRLVIEQRLVPTRLAVCVAHIFRRRIPSLEVRVFQRRGKRIASALVRSYA